MNHKFARKKRTVPLNLMETLEERANPSGAFGTAAPMSDFAANIGPVANAYANFANTVRSAELNLMGTAPQTAANVSAQIDQAISQLNSQLTSGLGQIPNASNRLNPLLQLQLVGPGPGSLAGSADYLFQSLGTGTYRGGSYNKADLATAFHAMEGLMAQSFNATAGDLYSLSNANYSSSYYGGQPSGSRSSSHHFIYRGEHVKRPYSHGNSSSSPYGSPSNGGYYPSPSSAIPYGSPTGSFLNFNQTLPMVQTAYANFASGVRTAVAGMSGTAPASQTTVASQIGQLVTQLDAQLRAAFGTDAQANSQLAPLTDAELLGNDPGSLNTVLQGLVTYSATSRTTGAGNPAVRDAAIEGLMAQSYQTTAGNLYMFTQNESAAYYPTNNPSSAYAPSNGSPSAATPNGNPYSYSTPNGTPLSTSPSGTPLYGSRGILRSFSRGLTTASSSFSNGITTPATSFGAAPQSGLNGYFAANAAANRTSLPFGGLAVPVGAGMGGLYGSGGFTSFGPINSGVSPNGVVGLNGYGYATPGLTTALPPTTGFANTSSLSTTPGVPTTPGIGIGAPSLR